MATYGMAVQTIDIKPEFGKATEDEISKTMGLGLNQILQKTHKGLNEITGGKGEILSHSLTRVGNHLVLSILTRH